MSHSQRRLRHHTLMSVAVGLSAVLALGACTNAAKQQDQANAAGKGGPAQDGGTLTVAQTSDADPGSFLKTSVGNIVTEYSVLETLTRISAKTGKPEGVLAKSWRLAPDGKSMDIRLKPGIKFHSGAPLTAKDVVFTLQKVKDPGTGAANQAIAADITKMQAVGDEEVKLTFARPLPSIFDLLETMPILNPNSYAKYAAGKTVDGTGPFTWKSWTPGGKIVLAKNPDYRDAKSVHLKQIVVDIITDPTALLSAIRSGQVQYAVGMGALNAYTLSKQSGYNLISTGGSAIPLGFDVKQKPFDKKAVRQAAQYAIDRDRIVKQVESGQGTATSLPWKTSAVGYDKSQADHYKYDPKKAKQLLQKAGVGNVSFDMVTLNTPEAKGIFQIVKNNLDKVGLHANAVTLSATEFDARIAAGNMKASAFLLLASNGLSPASAVLGRAELLASKNPENLGSPKYTQLVREVSSATTEGAQVKALSSYNKYFLDQAFAVPLITRPSLSVSTSDVHGVTGTQMGFIDLTHAWVNK